MKKIFSFLLLIALVTSCNNQSGDKLNSEESEKAAEPLSYLALGDSYTIGESVAAEQRWPEQLVDSLRERGVQIKDPRIIAKTGWTTQDLLTAMTAQLGNEQYDLVSVLIGVNNQYQGKSIAEYEKDLEEIFTRAIAHSKSGKSGVFAVSIPDYGVTPFGASRSEEIAAEIAQFNAVFQKKATEFGIPFYDITPISKRGKDEPELVANDGLHPSGKMYSLWVEEFIDEVVEKISSEI